MEETNECSSLIIEITRRCNFSCGHCLRGDAKNVDFKIEYLKNFLNTTDQRDFPSLTITGGEPFLKPGLIHDIIDCLRMYNVSIDYFYIATNGSKFNKRAFKAIKALLDFCMSPDLCQVEISNSSWHQAERQRLGISSYIPDSYEDFLEEHYPLLDRMYKEDYFSFDTEFMLEKDHRKYSLMLNQGRNEYGEDPTPVGDNLIYLNAVGNIIYNYCDLSYESQKDKKYQKAL